MSVKSENPRLEIEPRTFVLVHGAMHGGWCWRRVADRLRGAGHQVYTPTLTGLGERAHLSSPTLNMETWVEDILGVLVHEELEQVILVGHSLGGGPITWVADRVPERIQRLVYFDAMLVEAGQSILDGMPVEEAEKRHRMAAAACGSVLPVPPTSVFAEMLGMNKPEDIAWVGRHLTPQPFSAYTDKWQLANPLGNGVQTSYVICTKPLHPPTERARELARKQPGWQIVELDACHNAMVEYPDITTEMLIRLSR